MTDNNFTKIIGQSIAGVLLAMFVILFTTGAVKIGVTLYKNMSFTKAVLTCLAVGILFSLLAGFGKDRSG